MYHFIINPSAGNGRSQKSWAKIQQQLCQLNLKHSYYLTTSSTDLKQHLRLQAKREPKTVFVILGGDGTLYHALNAVAFPTKLDVILGYIPCGSGNDFAKAAQISTDPNKALAQLLAQKAPRTLDLGYFKTSDRAGVFSNNLGLGFDAQIVEITNNSHLKNQLNKLHLGKFAYATCFFKALRRQKNFELTVTSPNFPPKNFSRAFLCTITDQPYF
ncbi:MAG: lipid kinase, partial [Ligilactobacillus sp.]|nr:lipid kinase [Ligilactobacillus sp.]